MKKNKVKHLLFVVFFGENLLQAGSILFFVISLCKSVALKLQSTVDGTVIFDAPTKTVRVHQFGWVGRSY